MIKNIYMLCVIGVCSLFQVQAQNILTSGAKVDNVRIHRDESVISVAMNIWVNDVEIKSNRSIAFTPIFYNDDYAMELPAVKILGRKRYIKYQREEENGYVNTDNRIIKYADQSGKPIYYKYSFPYEEWMKRATLRIDEDVCGCSNAILGFDNEVLATTDFEPPVFIPVYTYIRPQVEEIKERNESGSAYLNFPVNRTEINPTFGNNASELNKINEAIKLVKNDPDVVIKEIFIKGFASPEGSYKNNERLAKGRTEALKLYVQEKMYFDSRLLITNYEPENWVGLRKYVAESSLKDKKGILALIDGSMEPDAKERKIKSTYPDSYRYLLNHCYPSLRRTDYVVKYTVKAFDVNDAKRVLKTRPQKLSQQEMYLVAQTYEVGSPEFNEVFDIAIRMFPEDPTANLNAANIAMSNNLLTDASKYLAKAGDAPEAIHARGILAGMKGEYEEALRLLNEAESQGVFGAKENREQIEKFLK